MQMKSFKVVQLSANDTEKGTNDLNSRSTFSWNSNRLVDISLAHSNQLWNQLFKCVQTRPTNNNKMKTTVSIKSNNTHTVSTLPLHFGIEDTFYANVLVETAVYASHPARYLLEIRCWLKSRHAPLRFSSLFNDCCLVFYTGIFSVRSK